jgi:hypothetical protein
MLLFVVVNIRKERNIPMLDPLLANLGEQETLGLIEHIREAEDLISIRIENIREAEALITIRL